MGFSIFLFLAVVAGTGGTSSLGQGPRVMQSPSVSNLSSVIGSSIGAWKVQGRAQGNQLLTLHIFVAHAPASKAELHRRLWSSSDPASAQYGKHMSFEEMNVLLRPSAEALDAVRFWLKENGVHWDTQVSLNPAEDILEVTLPIRDAEKLLQAEYHVLTAVNGKSLFRTGQYVLPAHVARYIDTVGPTTRIPLHPAKVASAASAGLTYTTPENLRERYGATGVASTSNKNSYAVCGFLDQYFDPKDVDYFFKSYDKQSVGKQVAVEGPNVASSSGMEATVDVCYGSAMAAGTETTFWSTKGRMPGHSDNEPLLQWLSDLSKDASPPLVFSFSYSDDEDTVDASYAERVNVELQKAGARGLSIVESSGDGGVAGIAPRTSCPGGKFMATFPATSPYVTSVGGTGGAAGAETASTHYPSGGGFSTWQQRPSFQDTAVDKYLQNGGASLPSSSLFNSSNRGYPDVSLMSEDYALTQYSISINVDGTSCSAPVFGALVALLNDARLSKGLPSLGWLNPLLYAHPEAFTDITQGSNPACGSAGFPAASGWDPVTGLGTPKFKAWLDIVQKLPEAVVLV